MRRIEFTEIQLFNLSALLTLRDGARHDPAWACCTFGVPLTLANQLAALAIDDVLVMVAQVGQQSLFVPRTDLAALLALPAPLAGPFTAAHAVPGGTAPR